ncbi:MAG TPA: glycosyltransferase family 2 protein [Candidatus Binataceae bacterium]|nr:glycosyltransferase family 2 protein [Candidatus Binataceae bacterium]
MSDDRLKTPHAAQRADALQVSVVMPCLNEAETVGICVAKAVETLTRLKVAGEVVVADNGSTDGSQEIARRAGARVVNAPRRGYGSALMSGFEEARAPFIIFADSDDSYDLRELGPFIDRLSAGADLVIGTRRKGTIKPGAMPALNRFGNFFFAMLVRVLFGPGISDVHSGMRGFTRDALQRMSLGAPGMEFASEMAVKAKLAGLRIEEVPITHSPAGRSRAPHLRPFRDGWRHLKLILDLAVHRKTLVRESGENHRS